MKKAQIVFIFLGILVVAIQIYTILTPNDIIYSTFPDFDKILHFTSGMVIAGLLASTLKKPSLAKVVAVVLVLGAIWEVVEVHMLYDASADSMFDMVFNFLGAVTAVLLVEAEL